MQFSGLIPIDFHWPEFESGHTGEASLVKHGLRELGLWWAWRLNGATWKASELSFTTAETLGLNSTALQLSLHREHQGTRIPSFDTSHQYSCQASKTEIKYNVARMKGCEDSLLFTCVHFQHLQTLIRVGRPACPAPPSTQTAPPAGDHVHTHTHTEAKY